VISYLSGKIAELHATHVIIECNGIGYHVNISLNTYSRIQNKENIKLLTYLNVREDAHVLFGFADELERSLFMNLISVSGIGPNTARMILSSYPPDELRRAIANGNQPILQSIKGVGPKSAQRIILELKDKVIKLPEETVTAGGVDNTLRQEALMALTMLGIGKTLAEKAVTKVLTQKPDTQSVEQLVKAALQNL
jgi:Holliday junction DNA helicase RuvA